MASRRDIEFKASDGTVLRGWFYAAADAKNAKAPTIVMGYGFGGVKEMDLDYFMEFFQKGGFNTLTYDHRNCGASDTGPGSHRQEIVPYQQVSDWSDAITFALTLPETDPDRIGIWVRWHEVGDDDVTEYDCRQGSSFAGGHSIMVGVNDRRVKAVACQVAFLSGSGTFRRLCRQDFVPEARSKWAQDRMARFKGEDPTYVAITDPDPMAPVALPTADSWEYFNRAGIQGPGAGKWQNRCTVRSVEILSAYEPGLFIHLLSPTPLLMTVAHDDILAPADIAFDVYEKARHPKQLQV